MTEERRAWMHAANRARAQVLDPIEQWIVVSSASLGAAEARANAAEEKLEQLNRLLGTDNFFDAASKIVDLLDAR